MIKLLHNYDCVGCSACSSACANSAITMTPDKEGFVYPITDSSLCNDCGLCNKVCPVIIQAKPRMPIASFAAINKDERIRLESSSGGVFSLLANKTLEAGGVVFGACFDSEWNVVHSFCETKDDFAKFRGSKYVQSKIGDTFKIVKDFLKQGREVLFSGTPCQVAGLRLFLRGKYDNLFTIDFICHGVPSPIVWQKYRDELLLLHKADNFNKISFRNKDKSWRVYSLKAEMQSGNKSSIFSETVVDNVYLKGFVRDLFLRPSCYSCPSKSLRSGSDITLADFWDIKEVLPDIDEVKGISLVLTNTSKGSAVINSIESVELIAVDFATSVKKNKSLFESVKIPYNRSLFWRLYGKRGANDAIVMSLKISFNERVLRKIKNIFK